MLANGLGIDLDDTKTLLQETKTLAALAEISKGENITFQFPVGPYRVDVYLPAYNIVVECDEHEHHRYNKEHKDMRAQYIEDTIGCRFVRFDPDDASVFSKQPIRCSELIRQCQTPKKDYSISTGHVTCQRKNLWQ